MNFLKKYSDYIQDNPEKLWFKRKLYGWGWTPVRWQGWCVILFFVLFVVECGLELGSHTIPTTSDLVWFFVRIILAVVLLISICYRKGEKPKWQWGLPDKK